MIHDVLLTNETYMFAVCLRYGLNFLVEEVKNPDRSLCIFFRCDYNFMERHPAYKKSRTNNPPYSSLERKPKSSSSDSGGGGGGSGGGDGGGGTSSSSSSSIAVITAQQQQQS